MHFSLHKISIFLYFSPNRYIVIYFKRQHSYHCWFTYILQYFPTFYENNSKVCIRICRVAHGINVRVFVCVHNFPVSTILSPLRKVCLSFWTQFWFPTVLSNLSLVVVPNSASNYLCRQSGFHILIQQFQPCVLPNSSRGLIALLQNPLKSQIVNNTNLLEIGITLCLSFSFFTLSPGHLELIFGQQGGELEREVIM